MSTSAGNRLGVSLLGTALESGAARALVAAHAGSALFVTAPEPWALLAGGRDAVGPARVVMPGSMMLQDLERLAAEVPAAPCVIGIGGGSALDTAKFIVSKRGGALILVPSILSVDAAFTTTAAVRESGSVRYVGDVAARIVIDPELIRSAPPELNRAGVGDLLSCHTGIFDWRVAEAAGHPAGPRVPWDDEAARVGYAVLGEVRAHAREIGAVDDVGIALLAGGFHAIGALCRRTGHARFEEGSEHFLAYALEAAMGTSYLHGELVAFTTLAMAIVQKNAPEVVAQTIHETGVCAGAGHLGIDEAVFVEVLTGLRAYVRRNDLWWSIVDERDIARSEAEHVWQRIEQLLPAPSHANARGAEAGHEKRPSKP